MGWYSELINERKRRNKELFEASFKHISSSVFGKGDQEKDPLHMALSFILKHYKLSHIQLPKKINDLTLVLDSLLSRHNLLTHPILLQDDWQIENREPIIAFTKSNKTPVALFPKGSASYYYIHPENGKKIKITSQIEDIFEEDAITFFHPLPKKKLTLKDYLYYIHKHIRVPDIILTFVLVAITTGLGLLIPILMKILMGDVINNKDYSLFLTIALSMIGAASILLLIKAGQTYVNARIAIKVEHTAHSSLMMRLLSLPTSFFKSQSTGELQGRINSVSALCNVMINGVFIAGLSSLLSLIYLGQIAAFSSELILPSLAVTLVDVAVTVAIAFMQRRVYQKSTKLYAEEKGVSYDLIQGIQKIRLTGSEKRAFAKWASYYAKAARSEYNPPLIVKIAPVFSAFITIGGELLIYRLVAKSNIDSATYIAFTTSYGALSGALLALSGVVSNAVRIKPYLELIRPILEAEPENNETQKEVESLEGDIKLDHVSFKYEENCPLILDDLSLHIQKGEYVAIVGKTGCGKSTIVRLLLGFEKPTQGHVLYDDKDIETLNLPSLRSKIGSVTQNGNLFHADIFHNIIISAPELKEADAWEAAKIARIDDDIQKMPLKMRTVISEGQGGISGGQKQRIMIARAVVNKPKILIFDEATSALDNQRQKDIAEALAKLQCTRIVIAHRLSTIKQCDRILYLEGGKVVEEGTYEQLIELGGKFKSLIERQKVE